MRLLASLQSPEKAICHVFGSYCEQALQVARCESGLRTCAQNGQYLGMFQMGSNERPLFGHGDSRARAGEGSPPLLRPLGPRLESVVLQALGLAVRHNSCANCGTWPVGRVPTNEDDW